MKKGISNICLVVVVYLAFAAPAFAERIVAWGQNGQGGCDIPKGNSFTAIACGWDHNLALQLDGSLVAWGLNNYGQCNVPAGNDFAAIACGTYHSLALVSDGSLVAWGDNSYGRCNVPAGNDFAAISSGPYHNLAIRSDGSLVGWGLNNCGQCNVPSGNDFVAISCGWEYSIALRFDGSLIAWGRDKYGECKMPSGNDFVAAACGGHHGLALVSDGSLVMWGWNNYGQCDVPPGNDFAAIACGGYHSLALKLDGSLAAWGLNNDGQCDVPDRNDFIAIAAKSHHSLALVSTPGTLVGIEIVGPNNVGKNYHAQYKAFAYDDDGSAMDVTDLSQWRVEPEAIASIETGLLTTQDIDQPQNVTIYAEYTEGEIALEATIVVDISLSLPPCVPGEYGTIQAAIDAASNGDIIVVADGTYTGDGNRDIDFLGKAITVRSENGAGNCIIDCNGTKDDPHRGFYFHNAEDANSILDGFTITNGYASQGGGVFCDGSSPTISRCMIKNNATSGRSDGGGIYCKRSDVTITNSIVSNNTTSGDGGGISCWWNSKPIIRDCNVFSNSAYLVTPLHPVTAAGFPASAASHRLLIAQ